MARLFPIRSETQTSEGRPRVVGLADEDADAVFGALSSTMARRIYGHLAEEPATPSDVAEAVDTSIQNVRYHLEKLEDAGLIEEVDTWYSSRGNEMSVYAASDGPLVVAADRSRADKLRDALSRYLGGLAVLAGASLFVQYGVERLVSAIDSIGSGFGGDDAGPEGAGDSPAGIDDDSGVEEAADDDAIEAEDVEDGDAVEEESVDPDSTDPGGEDEEEAVAEGAADAPNESETPVEPSDTPTPEETPPTEAPTEPVGTETPVDHAPEATEALLGTLPPGLVFFLGGLCVLTLVTVWWYRTPY